MGGRARSAHRGHCWVRGSRPVGAGGAPEPPPGPKRTPASDPQLGGTVSIKQPEPSVCPCSSLPLLYNNNLFILPIDPCVLLRERGIVERVHRATASNPSAPKTMSAIIVSSYLITILRTPRQYLKRPVPLCKMVIRTGRKGSSAAPSRSCR